MQPDPSAPPEHARRCAAIVLAAGAGVRMGGPKADLVIDGIRLLDRVIGTVVAAGCAPVVAVIRPGTLAPAAAVATVENLRADDGMRTSLEAGVAAMTIDEADPAAVVLVDTPGITTAAVAEVVTAWRPGRIAVGVTAADGVRRRVHPTVMSRAAWRDALEMAGPDEGARRYLAAHADLVDEVLVEADGRDLDTPADLAAWLASDAG